jgi:hypothetical protein
VVVSVVVVSGVLVSLAAVSLSCPESTAGLPQAPTVAANPSAKKSSMGFGCFINFPFRFSMLVERTALRLCLLQVFVNKIVQLLRRFSAKSPDSRLTAI